MLLTRDLHCFNDVADTVGFPHQLAVLNYPMKLVLRRCRVGKRACDPLSMSITRVDAGERTLQNVEQTTRIREAKVGVTVLEALQQLFYDRSSFCKALLNPLCQGKFGMPDEHPLQLWSQRGNTHCQ